MAKDKVKGFSTDPDDATSGGIFGPGRAKFLKCRFALHKYKNKAGVVTNKAIAFVVQASRSGEKALLAWTVGNGFGHSEDGSTLIPKEGQTGLSDSCNLYHLVKSLKDSGAPKEVYASLYENAGVLDGVVVDLIAKPLPRINDEKKRDNERERSVLVIDNVIEAPWIKGSGKKKRTDDDDEDADADTDADADEDEEEEEEEKPKSKKKPAKDDDDDEEAEDEDEDEKPKGKKKKPAKDEDEEAEADDDADEDLDEPATEALIEALTDGPIKVAKVKDAILAGLPKKLKNRDEIAERAADPKFLKKEVGWTFNGKVVDLDK